MFGQFEADDMRADRDVGNADRRSAHGLAVYEYARTTRP
jgi:hypothetical protein